MKAIPTLLLATSLLLSAGAWAEGGGDRVLRQLEQLRDKSAAALQQAEQAPADQRHAAMGKHMQMLDAMMTQLHGKHPDPSMSPEQQLAWMEEHDKLMADALGQMQHEHKLMMSEWRQ